MIKKMASWLILASFLAVSWGWEKPAYAKTDNGETKTIAISAAAFRPERSGYTYTNSGFELKHTSYQGICSDCTVYYYAPLHLPQNATITGLSADIKDPRDTLYGTVELFRTAHETGTNYSIASVSSPPNAATGFINYHVDGLSTVVNNPVYAYFLRFTVPMEQTAGLEILLGTVRVSYTEGTVSYPTYYSISPADYTPSSPGIDYTNTGGSLRVNSGSLSKFVAGIDLPHGSSLSELASYYHGTPPGAFLYTTIYNADNSGAEHTLGFVGASINPGNGSSSTSFFSINQIDHENHVYYLQVTIPVGATSYGAVIAYTPGVYSSDETLYSFSAANFIPKSGDLVYENLGKTLKHTSGGASIADNYVASFSAPPENTYLQSLHFILGDTTNSSIASMKLRPVIGSAPLDPFVSLSSTKLGLWYETGLLGVPYGRFTYPDQAFFLSLSLPASTDTAWVKTIGARGQWTRYKSFLPTAMKSSP